MKTLVTLIILIGGILSIQSCKEDIPAPPANQAPVVAETLPDIELTAGFGIHTIELENIFTDDDQLDFLSYSATTSEENVVTVNASGSDLSLAEVGALGNATIVVTAEDLSGAEAQTSFTCTVVQ